MVDDKNLAVAPTQPLNWTRAVSPIVFHDKEGVLEFSPLVGITPHETALLLVLFTNAFAPGAYGDLLWREYVNENGLRRHFK